MITNTCLYSAPERGGQQAKSILMAFPVVSLEAGVRTIDRVASGENTLILYKPIT